MVAGTVSTSPAGGATGEPNVSLKRTTGEVLVEKYGRGPVRLEVPVYVQSMDAPFDLRVRRASYKDPLVLYQVRHTSTGEEWTELGSDVIDGWRGLTDFTSIKIRDDEGKLVYEDTRDFCPNNWDRQRMDDSGPTTRRYPDRCSGSGRGFLKGMTWGIEQSWGVPLTRNLRLDVPAGSYEAVVRIKRAFRELFAITYPEAVAKFDVTVQKMDVDDDEVIWEGRTAGSGEDDPRLLGATPNRPDLQALPAFHIDVVNENSGKSRIEFAANIWNAGPSPLVVEGFRRPDSDVMDAYQYFYDGREVVGREPAGEMEYHRADGHFHWHFLQFARYRLVGVDSETVVRSKKQGFCLLPTDAIDLSLSNASYLTEEGNLYTACGGAGAAWIREVLPVGWGDTYTQVAGQAINVTNVPNGEYWLEVEANPLGLLHESDMTNNLVRRKVILWGQPGNRTIVVRNWQGIDF